MTLVVNLDCHRKCVTHDHRRQEQCSRRPKGVEKKLAEVQGRQGSPWSAHGAAETAAWMLNS